MTHKNFSVKEYMDQHGLTIDIDSILQQTGISNEIRQKEYAQEGKEPPAVIESMLQTALGDLKKILQGQVRFDDVRKDALEKHPAFAHIAKTPEGKEELRRVLYDIATEAADAVWKHLVGTEETVEEELHFTADSKRGKHLLSLTMLADIAAKELGLSVQKRIK